MTLLGPIENEATYDLALEAEETLGRMVRENGDHPLGGVYRSLLTNIAAYEARAYPTPAAAPHEILEFLMEQRNMRQGELATLLGMSQSNVSRLLAGKLGFTTAHIEQLSRALGVSGAVFVAR